LCLVSSVFADDTAVSKNNIDLGLYELRLKQYELDKGHNIDKVYALAMTSLLPGSGHIYAGEPGRGLFFAVGEILFLLINAMGTAQLYKTATNEEYESAIFTISWGAIGFTIVKIFEMYDAMLVIDEKNEKLRDSLGLKVLFEKEIFTKRFEDVISIDAGSP
jgi:hypothetical protein